MGNKVVLNEAKCNKVVALTMSGPPGGYVLNYREHKLAHAQEEELRGSEAGQGFLPLLPQRGVYSKVL